MQLNTLYQYFFRSNTETFRIDYFLTTDTLSDQVNSEGNVWLVISLEGEDKQKFVVSKPASILHQPREIIEVIIQRETVSYLHQCITA
jgi:hypothetical protein